MPQGQLFGGDGPHDGRLVQVGPGLYRRSAPSQSVSRSWEGSGIREAKESQEELCESLARTSQCYCSAFQYCSCDRFPFARAVSAFRQHVYNFICAV